MVGDDVDAAGSEGGRWSASGAEGVDECHEVAHVGRGGVVTEEVSVTVGSEVQVGRQGGGKEEGKSCREV